MPIREMLAYARLRAEGASTAGERRALLERIASAFAGG